MTQFPGPMGAMTQPPNMGMPPMPMSRPPVPVSMLTMLQQQQAEAERVNQMIQAGMAATYPGPTERVPIASRLEEGKYLGMRAQPFEGDIGQYTQAMLDQQAGFKAGQQPPYPGSFQGVDSSTSPQQVAAMQENMATFRARQDEKFAQRQEARVPDATRRELVTAKARGESPLETRLALGTISPEDLAILAGPEAMLAMPEAQAARAANELEVAQLALQGQQALAKGGALGAGANLSDVQGLFGVGQAAGEGVASVIRGGRELIAQNLPPALLEAYDEAVANGDEKTATQIARRAGLGDEEVKEIRKLIASTRDPTFSENLKPAIESWYSPPGLLGNLAYQVSKLLGGGPPEPARTSEAARARTKKPSLQ